jgi:hypothetical protein
MLRAGEKPVTRGGLNFAAMFLLATRSACPARLHKHQR